MPMNSNLSHGAAHLWRKFLRLVLLGAGWAAADTRAATFLVTVTNDSGPGSFRQAIQDANATPGMDSIHFNLGGAGQSISPATALPAITEPVTIDGSTQPGFATTPIVELNGQSAGTGTDGLRVWSGAATIRALIINRFNGDGIEIATNGNNVIEGCWIGLGSDGVTRRPNANGIFITNSSRNVIGGTNTTQRNLIAGNNQNGVRIEGTNALANVVLGNFIGLDFTGTTNRNNGNNGVHLLNAPSNVIGGATALARNLIAGNSQAGVRIENAGARGNRILGNFIGTDLSGARQRGNGGEGVTVQGNAPANTIGGANPGEANLIAFNGSDGIFLQNGTNNSARANAVHSNVGLGIDLGNNGVQANDAGDADSGANDLQNFPVLTGATNTAAGLSVAGTLNSRPNAIYTLDIYSNLQCDPTAHGEGQVWLASFDVTTAADGNATFSTTLPAGASGRFITATSTDANGNTSEFSPCIRSESTLPPLTFTVTNTSDSGPGSLRQAILDNNLAVRISRNLIAFAIPEDGPHVIAPASALPTITEAVEMDGFTQPGSASNSLPAGNNAVWRIVLDGAAISVTGTDGVRLEGNGCLIQGLAIHRFPDNGIELATNAQCTVRGCLIGLGLDGSDQGNANSGIFLINSSSNLIGGTTPDARNVVSGQNSFHGIGLSGSASSNNVIQGNFIGTGLDGTGDRGNAQDGININGASDNLVGGAAPGAGNVISGNRGDGVEINGASATGNHVLGNLIGLDATGTGALGNAQHGIQLTSNARSNVIGGALSGEGNRIAYQVSGDGITVASGTNNTLRANAIFNNGGLGIDLANNGTTANDVGDADAGANQGQNFPLLDSATLLAGSTTIAGTLNSRSNSTYALDFFSNLNCDPSTNGEGQVYLGSAAVTTGADGKADFGITLPVTAVGRFITATATDPSGNTSEFGPCLRAESFLPPRSFSVTNTHDSGPGSLRQAILDNNATYFGGPNIISFAIPGAGPHTIEPASALPDITEPVIIDGFTQPGATPNTLADGNDAVLQVRLAGRPFTDGLRLHASGCVVRGLIVVNWGGDGIEIGNGNSNVVTGCFLGLNSDGTAAFNGTSSIRIENSGGNRIGGFTPADRNAVIGIFLTQGSSNTVVQGNFIGCGLRGTNTVGFPSYGIIIEDSNDNLIGGAVPGARNILSGHAGNAVHFRGSQPARNVLAGNFIGPDVTGLHRLGNARGISIEAGSGQRIGGVAAAERNVISGNGAEGVAVIAPASGNDIVGNWIGVDATGTGVLTNGGAGVFLTGHSNRVGGVTAGAGNVIGNNTGGGVWVSGMANLVRGNSIFNSAPRFAGAHALGINLGFDDVTPNDPDDADAGANQLQNFPLLSAASGTEATVQIAGALQSAPGTSYALDFYSNPTCDPSGYGEGQTYLGSTTVATDGSGHVSFDVTFPRPLAGRYVTATATDPDGNTSEFAPCFAASSTVPGATFTVTTTDDTGPGSLRQAILDANETVTSGNTIAFAIPGPGMHVLRPATPLPDFIEPVTIDGFTQPGAGANALPDGNNARWLIELNGGALAGGQQAGLRLSVAGMAVRGMRIAGFKNDGVEVTASHCVVAGNLIVSNGSAGVRLLGPANTVGGLAPQDRNVISANASYGIYLEGAQASANQVLGNFIGTDEGGQAGAGQFWGVVFWQASGNTVGGVAAGAANVIAYHTSAGVFVQGGTNNAVRANRIFSNGDLGVDLGFSGATPNDADDADTGANHLQNFPLITDAAAGVGSTRIRGTLDSSASAAFILDFFSSVECHWSGYGQGQHYLGSTAMTTDANGHGSFEVTLPATILGNVLTATATDAAGNTSEFSPCTAPSISLPGQIYIVSNVHDSGPGSLRQALLDSAAAANSTPDQILFNIPGDGVKVISLLSALPEPEDQVLIDGFSQPGASANTSSHADNAVLRVQLDGSAAASTPYGLSLTNQGNTVRGLSFTGFRSAGLALHSASNIVEGCWIGLAPSGLPAANTGSGLVVYGPANRIGGTAPAARNIIAGNDDYGLALAGTLASNNLVQGNFIGVGPSGTRAPGNGRDGIVVSQAHDNLIGGTNAGAANLIGGSGRHGIRIEGENATGNRVEANFIGAAFDFHAGLTNQDGGVLITGASSNTIGGWAEETANVIAFNDGPGVRVLSGRQNGVIGNDIGSNTGQDIQISSGANDNVQPPSLDWAVLGSTRVKGTFTGQPHTTYDITVMAEQRGGREVHRKRIGTFPITTDATGHADFDRTLPKSFPRRNTGRVFANATCVNSSSENSAGVALLGQGDVDLALNARLASDPVPRGQDALVLISLTNKSPTSATAVIVQCVKPPGCNISGVDNPHGPTSVRGDQVRCEVGTVPPGTGKTVTIAFEPTLPGGGQYQVYADGQSLVEPEGDPQDNSALTAFFVPPPSTNADIGVTVQITPEPTVHGEARDVSVIAYNAGTHAADGVVVSVPLPPALSFVSASANAGSAAHHGPSGLVTWDIPALAPGQAAQLALRLKFQVDPTRDSLPLLSATAFAHDPPDPNLANNAAFQFVRIHPPKLEILQGNEQVSVRFAHTAAPFELHHAASLAQPLDFPPVPPDLIFTTGESQVYFANPANDPLGTRFFRLVHPLPADDQIRVEIAQLHLNLDNISYPFSEWGAVDLIFKGQPGVRYFNLNLDHEWVVQNMPVTSHQGDDVWQAVRFNIPIQGSYGLPKNFCDVAYSYTPSPLAVSNNPTPASLGLAVSNVVVSSFPTRQLSGLAGEKLNYRAPAPLVGGQVVSNAMNRPGFPNRPQGINECAPAAILNSLEYLNQVFSLNLSTQLLSMETIKQATDWTPEGAPSGFLWWNSWVDNKVEYMEENNVAIETTETTDPQAAMEALRADHDVEIRVRGHVACVRAVKDLGRGMFSLTLSHDVNQGVDGVGEITEQVTFDADAGYITGDGGWGAEFVGFVIEKPKP